MHIKANKAKAVVRINTDWSTPYLGLKWHRNIELRYSQLRNKFIFANIENTEFELKVRWTVDLYDKGFVTYEGIS